MTGGCSELSPEPVSGDVRMLVLRYDPSDARYKLVVDTVRTLRNLRAMEGDAATIVAGAEIRVDYDQLARTDPRTPEEIEKVTYRSRGGPVDFAYFEVDGVVHPEDFHSLNIATTYFNFEKAHLFFASHGAPLFQLPVQYFPKFEEGPSSNLQLLTDNAHWDPILRTFAVLPFKDIKELPLGMNLGVVGHEFSHAVFTSRLFPEPGVPWLNRRYFIDPERFSPALNLNRSINEGLADYFGAVITDDPHFMRKSLSDYADLRRLDPPQPRCFTRELSVALTEAPHSHYDPYPMGSVLAAALWELNTAAVGRQDALSTALLDGMTELGARFREKEDTITLAHAIDALASAMPPDLKPRACGLLLNRFGLKDKQVPSCVDARAPSRLCQ